MQLTDFLKRLNNVKRSGNGNQYTAKCPGHDDKINSLSISIGKDNRILLHCHAGCSPERITQCMGLKVSDLWPNDDKGKPTRQIEAIYPYCDETGKLLYEVIRYKPKGFSQRRPDGKGGYIYNLQGIKPVLYKLPDVLKAVKEGKRVFIVEGERDVHTLYEAGLIGTCNSGGAGKWQNSFSDLLRDAVIIIIPDNDEPGRKHAERVAQSLKGKAKTIKVVHLPDMEDKEDVTDFFRKYGKQKGMKLLQELINEAKDLCRPEVNSLDVIDARTLKEKELPPVVFVVDGLISNGLSILAAPPKAGKSWLALWLCLRIAQGLPVWNRATRQGSVLYLGLEDSLNRLKERLNTLTDEMPDNLFFATKSEAITNGLIEQLEDFMLKHKDTTFVTIDTLQKVRTLRKDKDAYGTDYADAAALKEFADKHGLAMLIVHHTRKMKDEDPFNTISGSTGLTGAADNMYVIQKQSRTAQEAVFHATGRDIDPQELAIRFDENKTWQLVSEDAEEYMERKRFEDSPLFILCDRYLQQYGNFEGSASELHPLLATRMKPEERFQFPQTGQALSKELMILKPALAERGILFDRKHSGKRKIILQRINNTSIASIASKPFESQCSMVDASHSNNIPLASIASKPANTNDLDAKDDKWTQAKDKQDALKHSDTNTLDAKDGKDGNSYIDSLFSSIGM